MSKKSKNTLRPLEVREKFFIDNAKHKGFEITHATSEFVDNSIDAGAKNIFITKELQKNGLYKLTFADDGSGIPSDKIVECFKHYGYDRKYGKRSTSAFGVGSKDAMSFLTEQGKCEIISVHNGEKSSIYLSFKYGEFGISESPEVVPTTEKNGTTIIIPNVEMTSKDHNKLMDWLAFIYYPHYENNPDFHIYMSVTQKTINTVEEVKFVDVMYRNIWSYDTEAVQLHRDKKYLVSGETIHLKAFVFNQEIFAKENLFCDFDKASVKKSGQFTYDKSGIYWRLGSRYSNLGKGNFITMTNQYTLTNARIEIDISGPKLMKLFKVNVNKSKISVPKDVENHPELKNFFEELRLLVRGMVSAVKQTTKFHITEREKMERQLLSQMANSSGDFTGLKQSIKDLKPTLQIGTPETTGNKPDLTYENSLEGFTSFCGDNGYTGEIKELNNNEYSINDIVYHYKNETFMKVRGGGWTQDRDAYRIDYLALSPWAPFMDVPKLYGNKYIYQINTDHPYFDTYSKLPFEAKNQVNMLMMSFMATLLKMDKEVDNEEFITQSITMHNMMLQSWVKNFKDNSFKETIDISDTDLSLD
jgi:Histidine kinase-, DNA gyrase B-, and HSP90-like ATPase